MSTGQPHPLVPASVAWVHNLHTCTGPPLEIILKRNYQRRQRYWTHSCWISQLLEWGGVIYSEQNPFGFLLGFCLAIKIPGWPLGLTAKTPTSARNRTLIKEKIHIAEEKRNGNKILRSWVPDLGSSNKPAWDVKQVIQTIFGLSFIAKTPWFKGIYINLFPNVTQPWNSRSGGETLEFM